MSGHGQSFVSPTSGTGLRRAAANRGWLSCNGFESWRIARLRQLRPALGGGGFPSVDQVGVVSLDSVDESQAGLHLGRPGRREHYTARGGLIILDALSAGCPAIGDVETHALGVMRGGPLFNEALGPHASPVVTQHPSADLDCIYSA